MRSIITSDSARRPATSGPLLLILALVAGVALPARAQFTLPFFRRAAPKAVPKKTIVVEVRDTAGKPLVDAWVASPYLQLNEDATDHESRRGFATDEKGEAAVAIPETYLQSSSLNLNVSHDGHAAVVLLWNSRNGNVGKILPARQVVRLETGRTIGGFVQDADGNPLAGVPVAPNISTPYIEPSDDSTGTPRPATIIPMFVARDPSKPAKTDARGYWTLEDFPPEIKNIHLYLQSTDGNRAQFCTPDRMAQTPGGILLDAAALAATNAILKFPRGYPLRGVVVDPQGRPIAGATVIDGYGVSPTTQRGVTNTGADGRFVFSNRQPRQVALNAFAPGYALGTTILQITPETPEVRLTLNPGKPMLARLVSTNGKPVSRATWRLRHQPGSGIVQFWSDTTDEEGRIAWSNAPVGRVSYEVYSPRGESQVVHLTADGTEQVVTNRNIRANTPITVTGRVTDAATGQPIARFRVFRKDQNNNEPQPWVLGTNGVFDARLTQWYPGLRYSVVIRANEAIPWTSDPLDPTEGDTTLSVSLAREADLSGTILQPDGRPAVGAVISLPKNEWSTAYMNEPGRLNNNSSFTTVKTSTGGKYQLDGFEKDRLIVVTHPSGMLRLQPGDFRRTNVLQLKPWARLEGTVPAHLIPTLPGNIGLMLTPDSEPGADQFQVSLWSQVRANGRFVFTNIPGGEYRLIRQNRYRPGPTVYSHALPVTLVGGETTRVSYTLNGRSIVGTAEADSTIEINWDNDNHVLVEQQTGTASTPPNYEDFVVEKDYQDVQRAYYNRVNYNGFGGRHYVLQFDRDGGFRAEDVPPGTYELRLRITEPPTNRRSGYWSGNARELGSLVREVRIPAAQPGETNAVNLGSFLVPVTATALAAATTPAPELKAGSVDGKPFDLASLRGRHVVVLFWASWAAESTNQLARLVTLQSQLATQSVSVVTVNIDDSPELIRSRVVAAVGETHHLMLAGAERVRLTEAYGIETLPQVLLIDGEGRIVNRSSGTRTLPAVLRRLNTSRASR